MHQSFNQSILLAALVAGAAGITACTSPDYPSTSKVESTELPDSSIEDPANPPLPDGSTQVPAPPPAPEPVVDVLLFNGTGVSTSDWQSTEQIVKKQGWSYTLANSAQLNAMTLEAIAGYGTIIVPGGSGGTIASNLSTAARLNLRKAVRDYGVGYVGFCAGAWVAVGPEAQTNSTASYGFAVAKGSVLPAFYPGGDTSLVADMVDVKFADGSQRNLVWWGGPATPEWAGGVIARYNTGAPAISETVSGKGYVVISGPHPEAPQGWRLTAGTDSDGLDYDIAIQMIDAALNKKVLKAF